MAQVSFRYTDNVFCAFGQFVEHSILDFIDFVIPILQCKLSRDDWSEILSQTPNQYQKLQTDSRQWTLGLLVRYVKEYIGEEVCLDTISKALRRCKYRTGRSKLRIGSPDPDYKIKRERIQNLRSLQHRGN